MFDQSQYQIINLFNQALEITCVLQVEKNYRLLTQWSTYLSTYYMHTIFVLKMMSSIN